MPAPSAPTVSATPARHATSGADATRRHGTSGDQAGVSFGSRLQAARQAPSAISDQDRSNDDGASAVASASAATDTTPSTVAQAGAVGQTAASDQGASSDGSVHGEDCADTSIANDGLAVRVLDLIDQSGGEVAIGASTRGAPSASGKSAKTTKNPTDHATPDAEVSAAWLAALTLPAAAANAPATASGGTANVGCPAGIDLAGMGSGMAFSAAAGTSAGGDTTATGGGPASGSAGASSAGSGDGAQSALASSAMHLAGTLAISAAAPATPAPAVADTSTQTAALAAGMATPPVAPSATAHALSVNAPVGSTGFSSALSQQITWLSGQAVKQAQIRLHPQELGPLDVKVSVEHGRVDVAFMAVHPQAAAAVQQGLGQLNQMLGSQGLSLGQTTVGQHAQQQFAHSGGAAASMATALGAGEAGGDDAASVLPRVALGLLDAFA